MKSESRINRRESRHGLKRMAPWMIACRNLALTAQEDAEDPFGDLCELDAVILEIGQLQDCPGANLPATQLRLKRLREVRDRLQESVEEIERLEAQDAG